jgi:drug/metabolite transporter (DMT)-like permease
VAQHHLGRAVLWMSGAVLSFCVSAVSIRELAARLNLFEVLTVRSVIGLAVLLALIAFRREFLADIKPRYMGLHLIRNTVHYGGQYVWAWAITLLPLATVFTIEFTMPMWIMVLAVLFLGERMTTSRIGSLVLGFLGVLVVLRPGMESFQPAALLTLLAAFLFAVSLIQTKQLTNHVSTFAIVFWMCAMQLPMGLAGSDPLFFQKLEPAHIFWALGVGISGVSSHYCLSNAFRAGDASVVMPLDFLRIPLIALVGWLFYAEPVDVWVFAGAGLIVCGVLWNLRAEAKRPRPA